MKAIQEYKEFIGETKHLFEVFTNAIGADKLTASAIETWTIDDVKGYATGALRYKPDKRLKEELIGDYPDNSTLKTRLDYVAMELNDKSESYFFSMIVIFITSTIKNWLRL